MIKKKFGILAVVCLVHFFLGFDINITSISLSSISQYFNIPPEITSRIVWLYFLIVTCFLQIFGRIGDIKGYKNIYILGISIFSISSILCGLSQSFFELTLFRVLQAIGGAILFGLTPAIISKYFKDEITGKIFGINYSFVALGGVIGRFTSGLLIENFSWKAIFLVNIPIFITTFILGIFFIPREEVKNQGEKKFDLLGSFLIFSGLFGLLYFLNIVNTTDLHSYKIIFSLLLFLIFFPLFIYRELKISFPLLNLRLLRNFTLSKHLLIFLIIYIYTNGIIFISPFYLQNIFNYSVITVGFLMTITSIAQVFSGYISGHLADKINSRYILFSGMTLTFITFISFSLLNSNSNINTIIIVLGLYGISVGLSIPVNTKEVMRFAPQFSKGSVSGFMITIIRTGSALGICLFGILYSVFIESNFRNSEGNTNNYNYIFLAAAIISLVGVVITLTLKSNRKKEF